MCLQALAKTARPPRPGYCNIGQNVKIKVNHFEVKCNLTQAFHYDVVMSRPRKSKPHYGCAHNCIFGIASVWQH